MTEIKPKYETDLKQNITVQVNPRMKEKFSRRAKDKFMSMGALLRKLMHRELSGKLENNND